LYVDKEADWAQSIKVILNAKTQKISACNALDKILVDVHIDDYPNKLKELNTILKAEGVSVLVDAKVAKVLTENTTVEEESIWYEEFLSMKCVLGAVDDLEEAIQKINNYSGGHSATI